MSTKLVIGNGFDLHCNLKTKYADFFNYRLGSDLEFLKEIFENYSIKSTIQNLFYGHMDFFNSEKAKLNKILNFNVWDIVFFYYSYFNKSIFNNKSNEEILWCDVEFIIGETLLNEKTDIFWEDVFKIMKTDCNKVYPHDSPKDSAILIIKFILNEKYDAKSFENLELFSNILLKELNLFEAAFGKYIKDLPNYNDYSIEASATLDCDFNKIVKNVSSIESFNYTSFKYNNVPFYNINGNVNEPIFGINSKFGIKSYDYRYKFTKQSRRIKYKEKTKKSNILVAFDTLVVYGHSLNEADYSYFMSLFDNMNLLENKDTKIIFLFSIFEEKDYDTIKNQAILSGTKLLEFYSDYKHFPSEMFIENLNNNNRLIFLNLSELKNISF